VEKFYVSGVTYKKPRSDETWVGGTKGRHPTWLKELIASGRTFESLPVKGWGGTGETPPSGFSCFDPAV
jgi:hypothetical protein